MTPPSGVRRRRTQVDDERMVSTVPKTRPAYPEEFRREAVQMLRAGRTPRELAESLGVSEQTLRNWRRQDQVDRHERDDGLTSDEREELRRLRQRERASEAGARSAQTSRGLLRSGDRDPVTVYRMISAEKASTPVSVVLPAARRRALGLLRWASRAPSDRALADAWLTERITQIHAATPAGLRRAAHPRRPAARRTGSASGASAWSG